MLKCLQFGPELWQFLAVVKHVTTYGSVGIEIRLLLRILTLKLPSSDCALSRCYNRKNLWGVSDAWTRYRPWSLDELPKNILAQQQELWQTSTDSAKA